MMALHERSRHEEVWLLLPWLANERLAAEEREMAEEHVRQCEPCERELALQHLMCNAFTEPDRVTYAPGPSFRKLMDRIDGESRTGDGKKTGPIGKPGKAPQRSRQPAERSLAARLGHVSLWRPPGLAWAASFLILFGITGMMVTAYRWLEPVYKTRTDATSAVTPNVLHIALDRSLPIGEVEELLRTGGARIVEGPGNTGILGVTPVGVIVGQTSASSANKQLRALSARLRTDPRVLWVQPLADEDTPADGRAPDVRVH
jgi:hypothetical protein